MRDTYPRDMEIEIDRDALRRYLRVKWFLSWLGGVALASLFLGVLVTQAALDVLGVRGVHLVVLGIFGPAFAFVCVSACHFIFSHGLAARFAKTLKITVEGSFLHVYREWYFFTSDKKLHFRALVDYEVLEGPLSRRFGVAALRMTTTAGGPASFLVIPGLADCMRIRDTLAEIDRLREEN